jgi:hypothetical protein
VASKNKYGKAMWPRARSLKALTWTSRRRQMRDTGVVPV